MTRMVVYTLSIFALTNCHVEPQLSIVHNTPEIDKASLIPNITTSKNDIDIDEHLIKYERLKSRILKQKNAIKASKNINTEQKLTLAHDYLATTFVDSIFPYWVGTKWDYNGHTNDPLVGEVACGYFVTTTIRHLDVKINRFKVAQKASADIINDLCSSETISRFNTMDKFEKHLKTIDDNEVLIIGLDYHVGFIYKKDGDCFLAHSNYEYNKGVEIVPVENCFALESSNLYVVGNLTSNEQLLDKWMNSLLLN